jgi:RNA-binding protein
MDKYELRSKAKRMEPNLNLGKEGLTESVVEEIKRQLRRNKLIKIKMLPSMSDKADKKQIAKELELKTGAVLIDSIGFTYVLAVKSVVK